jgi:hypothetical protein
LELPSCLCYGTAPELSFGEVSLILGGFILSTEFHPLKALLYVYGTKIQSGSIMTLLRLEGKATTTLTLYEGKLPGKYL